MKKLLTILLLSIALAGNAQGVINDTGLLRSYIRTNIIPNSNRSITATMFSNILNGQLNVLPGLLNKRVDSIWLSGDTLRYSKAGQAFSLILPTGSGGGGGSGTVTSFVFTNANGFTGVVTNATSTPSLIISQQNAAADGTTFGKAAFASSDFNSSSGLISIDYSNGQAATSSQKGFLTAADWINFNNKQPLIATGGTSQYFRGDLSLAPFPTNLSSFTNDQNFISNITGKLTGGTNVTITGSGTTADPYVINSSGGASGISSINGLTGTAQTIVAGSAGTDFGISSSGTTHTINIPTASASNRGLLSSANWTTFSNKQNAIALGTTSQYFRGDLSLQTFPTDLSSFANGPGYLTTTTGDARYSQLAHVHSFASLTGKPTTISGYGITTPIVSSIQKNAAGDSLVWYDVGGARYAISLPSGSGGPSIVSSNGQMVYNLNGVLKGTDSLKYNDTTGTLTAKELAANNLTGNYANIFYDLTLQQDPSATDSTNRAAPTGWINRRIAAKIAAYAAANPGVAGIYTSDGTVTASGQFRTISGNNKSIAWGTSGSPFAAFLTNVSNTGSIGLGILGSSSGLAIDKDIAQLTGGTGIQLIGIKRKDLGTRIRAMSLDTLTGDVGFFDVATGGSSNDFTTAEKNKLAAIQAGATANSTDAQLRDRSTHTGTQAISTITGLQTALDSKLSSSGGNDIEITDATKGYITKSPDGSRWRIKVGNTGALETELVSSADVTAPTVTGRQTTSATSIAYTYSENVTGTSAGYSFTKNGSNLPISSVSGSGTNTLTFTVSTIANGDVLTGSYNSGTGNTIDAASNALATFSSQSVTNNVPDVTAPTVTSRGTTSTTTIAYVFSENVTATNVGYSFTLNGGAYTPSSISGSGTNTLTFTFGTPIVNGDVLLGSYNSGTGNTKDAANNVLTSFTNQTITNNVPGGGGGGSEPDDFSGLIAWVDASDVTQVTKDGSNNVSQVADKSGNGNHLTQATGSNKPVFTTGGINGKSYLSMGVNQWLSKASLALAQPYTVYIVYRNRGGAVIGTMNAAKSVSFLNAPTALGSSTAFQYATTITAGGSQFGTKSNTYRLPSAGQAEIFKFAFAGDSSAIRLNREPQSPRHYTGPGTAAMENFVLNAEGSEIDFYEMFIFNRRMTHSEDSLLVNYLYSKYPVNNGNYIAFIGNSITEGQGASTQPNQFTWLVANELSLTRYNYGISGANLVHALENYNHGGDSQTENAMGFSNNGKLIFDLGYNNDFNKVGGGYTINSTTKATWKAYYKSFVLKALARGYSASNIFLFSPLHCKSAGSGVSGHSGTNEEMDEMATTIQAIASETGVVYGDLLHYSRSHASSYTMPDNIHPDDNGHRLIADYIKSVIAGSPLVP